MRNPSEEVYIKSWLTSQFPNIRFDVRFSEKIPNDAGPLAVTYMDGPPKEEVLNFLKAMGLREEALSIIRREKPNYDS